ncbi:MAG: RsmB/NOP family class I SAM-dependent RNA methyltransferase [Rhodobacter sp.]|nr:RsmB/NOP family class I SAM-dependent RNA methyltransferase [Paracoccaceae bacterium]MCC0076834.1 RsmB/NOP family class I SAM-dependent RNA methyltransferase [Rhodobacter sp.]
MTPAARQSAAIAILDRWIAGQAAEAALTQWGRASRFAGSGDREAVRDLVFRAVRQRRSAAALGGGEDGRALLLGLARMDGAMPEGWTGERHAPAPLTPAEAALFDQPVPELPRGVALDCPDWLLPAFDAALGDDADAVLAQMRDRAPVFVRVNIAQAPVASVQAELTAQGIAAQPHPLAVTALEITENARRLRNTEAFSEGRIEMQDAASQAVALQFAAEAPAGTQVLDYCAGGGGKALALAAQGLVVSAHDADPRRMRDIPVRAGRAGAAVRVLDGAPKGGWTAIFADAPCSGSGSWRRAPEAKWAFTAERLQALTRIQDEILAHCARLTAPGGVLGYATCSMLRAENEDRVTDFLAAHPGWRCTGSRRLSPLDGGDGFFLAILRRD